MSLRMISSVLKRLLNLTNEDELTIFSPPVYNCDYNAVVFQW